MRPRNLSTLVEAERSIVAVERRGGNVVVSVVPMKHVLGRLVPVLGQELALLMIGQGVPLGMVPRRSVLRRLRSRVGSSDEGPVVGVGGGLWPDELQPLATRLSLVSWVSLPDLDTAHESGQEGHLVGCSVSRGGGDWSVRLQLQAFGVAVKEARWEMGWWMQ